MLYKKLNRKWILENFEIDMKTGTVRHRTGNYAGKVAGSENAGGYLMCKKQGKAFYIHRLVAQMKAHADISNYHVHHLDDDKGNNRPENLILLTHQEHNRIRKTSGRQTLRYRGIIRKKYSYGVKYFAKITHTGQTFYGPKRNTQLAAFKDYVKLFVKYRGLLHAPADIVNTYLKS